ncbi:hypothetical protein R4P47_23585 [Rhodococcus sp. IEGM 1370]|uniref:hypothetical protein n=1 Tax=Rhodococcus sp. IEGM 1370 TaxID=3082222 RepID=UPI002955643C|nr:hypothetical protein [Rhodococcus sp. IEGM 1370]MDV8079556.1 hypothetical protein [Rhodococcus sp. IEGM 1370]
MATVLDSAGLDRLTAAVLALNPRSRERRWVSLSLAIVDAVCVPFSSWTDYVR